MKITVFGANGRVGRKIVGQLLAEGDTVRAFVHQRNQLPAHENLEVIKGDIHDADAVTRAVEGSDAVISALGSWGTKTKDIQVAGMTRIIPAMQSAGVRRIISVTGTGAIADTDKLSPAGKLSRSLIGLFAGKILRDGEEHMSLLSRSQLDWTVVRAPAMVERTNTGGYRLSEKFPALWATIAREDVAAAMVTLAKDTSWLHAAPIISRQ